MQQNKKFKMAIAFSIAGMAFMVASGSIWSVCIAVNSKPRVNLSMQPLASSVGNWVANGMPICTNISDQVELTSCSDGGNGMIMAWQDYRSGLPHIYAQRIDINGNALWGANGMAICTSGNGQNHPVIVSDDAGGAIIGWLDTRTSLEIYAQHVDYTGIASWTVNGKLICPFESYTMANLRACIDGLGGAIFTWDDGRSGTTYDDIYAQRVNSSGNLYWPTGGVDVSSASGIENSPTIVPDGRHGAIISWIDNRNANFDIYSQRVNSTGNMTWTTHGVQTCVNVLQQSDPQSCYDDAYGTIITWVDYRSGSSQIYAQHINGTGGFKWKNGGLPVCNATSCSATQPKVCRDQSGGCIISWLDERNGGYTNQDIYAQHLTPSGIPTWTANGTAVCTASSIQQDQAISADSNGGICIAWEDYRDNATNKADIYMQHVDKNGVSMWPTNGRTVCTITAYQQFPVICTGASNNSIVAWQDNRTISTGFDIYAQYVTGLGHVVPGPMAPILTTDATSPDSDGAFHLTWGAIFDAVNYCVYQYSKPITSINSTITNLAVNYLAHQYNLTGLSSGVYYFVVTAVNEMGTTMSNVVQVTVQLPGGISFGMFPVVFIFAGLVMLIIVVNRRKKLVS